MAVANAIVVEAWNTILYDKFCRFKHLLVDGLSQHSDAAFERCSYPQGTRVLDVGCGFGDSTLRIARQVGPSGEAVGVDCAENFVRAAEGEARKAGVGNARFFVGDAQWGDLRGPYDHAFARFGTMFFMSPVAAFRNVRRALKPGGTFAQIVWRKREENPWVHEAERRVREIVPVVSHEETDQVHCGPGPFSLAGPDMVSAMMKASGYARVAFPIRSYSFSDDMLAPPRAAEALLAFYSGARIDRRALTPRDLGVKTIGHWGFFRERFRDPLWLEAADWLRAV